MWSSGWLSVCTFMSCSLIQLTTATKSANEPARDMPCSASWPIGKTTFLKSRRQTRYPEVRRFNHCLLCLRETNARLSYCDTYLQTHLLAHTERFLVVFDSKIFVPDMTPEPSVASDTVHALTSDTQLHPRSWDPQLAAALTHTTTEFWK